MERVKASAFRWTMDAAGDWLCIQTGKARKILDELKSGKDYDVEIKEHREKRSLNANSYCWVLLGKLAEKYEIPTAQTVAIGDGANDLPMIKAAGLGIAYHAKPKVNEQAEVTIRHADLMGVFCILSGSMNQK